MRKRRGRGWAARAAVTGALCAGSLAPAAARAAEEPLPPQGTPPPGANVYSCKPPARHPYPVVIVHGTFGNQSVLWDTVAGALERLHYCVFALDYGNSPFPGINGVGDIPTSARQLQTFINRVLGATHASKVTIVGHSQGGMMPRYYIKFLGGASKVDDVVGFSPSNHGTDTPLAAPAGMLGCPACAQQVAGSPFMRHLNAGDQTPAPVAYTVLETSHDEVVTPYQSEFLPTTRDGRVVNVLLQDKCPGDLTDHVLFPEDKVAVQWMLDAFGRPGPADPRFTPDCSGAALATFPDSSSVAAAGGGRGGGRARSARLSFARLARLTVNHRRLRLLLQGNGVRVRRVRVTLRAGGPHGRVVARSAAFTIVRRRHLTLRLGGALAAGRYWAIASGRDASGRIVSARRIFTVR
jgi:pimeloyl-ACP methyl ester carboxylesterase